MDKRFNQRSHQVLGNPHCTPFGATDANILEDIQPQHFSTQKKTRKMLFRARKRLPFEAGLNIKAIEVWVAILSYLGSWSSRHGGTILK